MCEVKIKTNMKSYKQTRHYVSCNINHAHYIQYNHAQIYNTTIQQCTSYKAHSLTTNSFYTKEKH
jgi:hypothetical protein